MQDNGQYVTPLLCRCVLTSVMVIKHETWCNLRPQFIYISREEMAAVAAFIKHRGRVAIAELAAKSDMLIDLESKAAQLPTDLAADDFFPGADGDSPAMVDVAA